MKKCVGTRVVGTRVVGTRVVGTRVVGGSGTERARPEARRGGPVGSAKVGAGHLSLHLLHLVLDVVEQLLLLERAAVQIANARLPPHGKA